MARLLDRRVGSRRAANAKERQSGALARPRFALVVPIRGELAARCTALAYAKRVPSRLPPLRTCTYPVALEPACTLRSTAVSEVAKFPLTELPSSVRLASKDLLQACGTGRQEQFAEHLTSIVAN